MLAIGAIGVEMRGSEMMSRSEMRRIQRTIGVEMTRSEMTRSEMSRSEMHPMGVHVVSAPVTRCNHHS